LHHVKTFQHFCTVCTIVEKPMSMLRFYLRLTATLMLLFILANLALSALGSTQPIHPALRGFVEGCEGVPQPCWYGIVPGVTTHDDAVQTLNEKDFLSSESIIAFPHMIAYENFNTENACSLLIPVQNDELYHLMFLCDHVLQVGDMFEIFDTPGEAVDFGYGSFTLSYGQLIHVVRSNRLSLYDYVTEIHLYSLPILPLAPYDGPTQHRWHGFLPLWRYCQLEPAYRLCL
jgi:hypothetical protein